MRKQTSTIIALPARRVEVAIIPIRGTTPYISHAWSDKARGMILDKQTQKPRAKKAAKDPWEDFCDSLYWLTPKPENPTREDIDKAEFGIPAISFKKAAFGACRLVEGVPMTLARIAFHIKGPFVKIEGKPEQFEAFVRLQTGVADIRYRALFEDWSATLEVEYNANVMGLDIVTYLISEAGAGPGVGDWRPEKGGEYGRFEVVRTEVKS